MTSFGKLPALSACSTIRLFVRDADQTPSNDPLISEEERTPKELIPVLLIFAIPFASKVKSFQPVALKLA